MFPAILDGAKVLHYTPKENYGQVCYTTGEISDIICYLAICKYDEAAGFYLFGCNEHFEVVSDSLWQNVEQCMEAAASFNKDAVWHSMD